MKLFKRKKDLRKECINRYGEEFGRKYDKLNSGVPMGNLAETIAFLDMVDAVKKDLNMV